jgi:dTDP-4-dehydrorhamnose reductase
VPKLLVTGASGYLGGALASRAAGGGWEVVGTYNMHRPGRVRKVRFVRLDVRDADTVRRLFAVEGFDAVVHTAYRQHGDDASAINRDGAGRVAACAASAGARMVHVSSDLVFRGGLGRALREDDPVDPVTEYGATKAAGEAAVAEADPRAVVARTSLLYGGPGREPSNHERLALDAVRGARADVTFFANEVRSPAQVDDVAAALLELCTTDVAGPLHVAGADAVDRAEFARLIATAAGEDATRVRAGAGPPDRPGDCALDSARAAALLSTRLRGVREVLGDVRR